MSGDSKPKHRRVSDNLPMTVEQGKVLEALGFGSTREAAAGFAGIGRATLYRWISASETFRDAVEKAEDLAEARHTSNIAAAASLGNWTASAWWLERRRSEKYGRRVAIDVSLQDEARKLADQYGLNADDVIAEAEKIIAQGLT